LKQQAMTISLFAGDMTLLEPDGAPSEHSADHDA
jgi:hypothetical protein